MAAEGEGLPNDRSPAPQRGTVVLRPWPLLLVLIVSCAGMGYAIYRLIRSAGF